MMTEPEAFDDAVRAVVAMSRLLPELAEPLRVIAARYDVDPAAVEALHEALADIDETPEDGYYGVPGATALWRALARRGWRIVRDREHMGGES